MLKLKNIVKESLKKSWDNICWFFESWGFLIVLPLFMILLLVLALIWRSLQ